jgi:hypothetical protein
MNRPLRPWIGRLKALTYRLRFVLLFIVSISTPAATLPPDQIEFFESRIRPILAQDCYECHSTATKQKGGLNLDHRGAWQTGSDSGPVIIPGKPEESTLIQAIRHQDEDIAMPKSGAKLDDSIIQDFVQWVAMGAPDPREEAPSQEELGQDQDWAAVLERRKSWWSFQPITDPAPPASASSRHPIDQFIEVKRNEAGLDPATPAEPNVLIRRLYFALIGLPPTQEQVESFLLSYQNTPELALASQVDELLASPHFGERWARHWMDWIRYAESHGSEGDPRIGNAHLYRDYLIRALNDDVPYDQLVREHVAGDQLEPPRINEQLAINESLIGTAHWRMVFHGFAPTDALDEKVRFTDDQINVFSKAFLGLTVSCARCHNHKFDAISQADYYSFFGIMGSTRPGRKAIDLPEKLNLHRDTLTAMKPSIREAVATDWLNSLPALRATLEDQEGPSKNAKDSSALLNPLFALDQDDASSNTGATLKEKWKKDDNAWQDHLLRSYGRRWDLASTEDHAQWYKEGTGLSSGPAKAGEFSIAGKGDNAIAGIHPSGTFTHLESSKHGGILTSPDFTLNDDYEIWMRLKGADRAMSRYVVFNYPRNGTVYPVREMRDDNAKRWHWQRYNVDYWKGDDIHLEVTTAGDAPLLVRDDERSWFGIREALVVKKGNPTPPNKPRRYLSPVFAAIHNQEDIKRTVLVDAYLSAIKSALTAWKTGEASDDQAELLEECRRLALLPNELEQLTTAKPLLAAYRQLENEIPVPTRIPTVTEWSARNQPLYDRGNHKRPLAEVPRRFLEAIDATPYQTALSGRRQLAEDLLRDDNPLARRVIVNRIWHHLFGNGLVNTPDNFGRLSATPSHPELLDHLASHFVNKADWSVKRMIRYLVTTKTWQLASEPSPEAQAQDPSNDLLTHFNIRRLEAEAIRDALLHVSGRLDPTAFGAPVKGDQPKRSVYVNVIRNRLDPFLNTFDAPIPFSAQGSRNATTVPSQSLTMMNSRFVVGTARAWGADLARHSRKANLRDLIESIWKKSFARNPSPQETDQTIAFIEKQAADYTKLAEEVTLQRQAFEEVSRNLDELREKARQRVRPKEKNQKQSSTFLNPIAEWLFDEDGQDSIGSLHTKLEGEAHIEEGALVVNGKKSLARSAPLIKDLSVKSLEAWVQLETLDQAGGAAISVQTRDGGVFDAIVFAERVPREWMAGSDGFRRTQNFDGPREEEADKTPTHLVLVYGSNGSITGYRNGQLYGKGYQSSGPNTFKSNQAEIVFGLRHGDASDGKLLKGRILEARLYDRALTQEEVMAIAAKDANFVSEQQMIGALSENEKGLWDQWVRDRSSREQHLKQLEAIAPKSGKDEVWADLALAVFNMKEFIYVR